jgi:hypothetical protein
MPRGISLSNVTKEYNNLLNENTELKKENKELKEKVCKPEITKYRKKYDNIRDIESWNCGFTAGALAVFIGTYSGMFINYILH